MGRAGINAEFAEGAAVSRESVLRNKRGGAGSLLTTAVNDSKDAGSAQGDGAIDEEKGERES